MLRPASVVHAAVAVKRGVNEASSAERMIPASLLPAASRWHSVLTVWRSQQLLSGQDAKQTTQLRPHKPYADGVLLILSC
jgi:hypothetical protein